MDLLRIETFNFTQHHHIGRVLQNYIKSSLSPKIQQFQSSQDYGTKRTEPILLVHKGS